MLVFYQKIDYYIISGYDFVIILKPGNSVGYFIDEK